MAPEVVLWPVFMGAPVHACACIHMHTHAYTHRGEEGKGGRRWGEPYSYSPQALAAHII